MTLPKAISDAIDAYRDCAQHDVDKELVRDSEGTRAARAALERAIADHVADAGKMVPATGKRGFLKCRGVGCTMRNDCERFTRPESADQWWIDARRNGKSCADFVAQTQADQADHVSPVDAPTEAEIEAWEQEAMSASIDAGRSFNRPEPLDVGTSAEAFMVVRSEIEQAVALMRRASAAKPESFYSCTGRAFRLHSADWHGSQDEMPKSVLIYGSGDMGRGEFANYLRADVARQAAATPQQVTAESIKEGFAQIERGEWVTPEQMAKAAAATPAPSALERLFDRIARMEVAQRGRVVQAEVLNMIDEEREREGRA